MLVPNRSRYFSWAADARMWFRPPSETRVLDNSSRCSRGSLPSCRKAESPTRVLLRFKAVSLSSPLSWPKPAPVIGVFSSDSASSCGQLADSNSDRSPSSSWVSPRSSVLELRQALEVAQALAMNLGPLQIEGLETGELADRGEARVGDLRAGERQVLQLLEAVEVLEDAAGHVRPIQFNVLELGKLPDVLERVVVGAGGGHHEAAELVARQLVQAAARDLPGVENQYFQVLGRRQEREDFVAQRGVREDETVKVFTLS